MPKITLTDLSVRALKPPPSGQEMYWDKDMSGFGVRVSQGGAKTFVILDPRSQIRARETIGRYPVINLKSARNEARKRLAEAVLGKREPQSVSWNVALQTYLAEIQKRRKPRTHADYKRLLEKHFRFGEIKVSGIVPGMIQQRIDKLADTPAEQQHAFVVVRAFINWCHRKSYLDRNPMDRMEEPKGYQERERVLTDDELRRVWSVLEDNTFGRILKLMILTGQRETEIAHLTGQMRRDENLIKLPRWLTKNSREHEFPVGPMALQLLPEHDGLLFPGRGTDKPFSGWSKCKKQLDKKCGVSGWRLHDLRRTFRTKWEELGILPTVAERYINHISGEHAGIRRVYNRYSYATEMLEAVAVWENWFQSLLAHGRQPTGHRDVSGNGGRDAALIEEATADHCLVLPRSHRPAGTRREIPEADTTRPRPCRVA